MRRFIRAHMQLLQCRRDAQHDVETHALWYEVFAEWFIGLVRRGRLDVICMWGEEDEVGGVDGAVGVDGRFVEDEVFGKGGVVGAHDEIHLDFVPGYFVRVSGGEGRFEAGQRESADST